MGNTNKPQIPSVTKSFTQEVTKGLSNPNPITKSAQHTIDTILDINNSNQGPLGTGYSVVRRNLKQIPSTYTTAQKAAKDTATDIQQQAKRLYDDIPWEHLLTLLQVQPVYIQPVPEKPVKR